MTHKWLKQSVANLGWNARPVISHPYFLIKVFTLFLAQVPFGEKLGIGENSRQWVAEIMRDRAGHASDGGQALAVKQLLLRFLERVTHPLEGGSQFGDFVVSARL